MKAVIVKRTEAQQAAKLLSASLEGFEQAINLLKAAGLTSSICEFMAAYDTIEALRDETFTCLSCEHPVLGHGEGCDTTVKPAGWFEPGESCGCNSYRVVESVKAEPIRRAA